MKDKDNLILESLYSKIHVLEEMLVLKRRTLENGDMIFVVDSNLEGNKAGGETFRNKKKIQKTGLFFWDGFKLRKWISRPIPPEEFQNKIPQYKKAIDDINREISGDSFEEISSDLEEILDAGVGDVLKEKIAGFLEELKVKIKEDADSEEVKKFFEFRKKFRVYSLSNQMLIYIQKRNATHVAGTYTWKTKFGRKIKKGAKGIYIWAKLNDKKKKKDEAEYEIDKDPKEDESKNLMRFKLTPIFDISDTEPIKGKEHLAEIPEEPKWWDETPIDEKTRVIFDGLLALAKFENIKVDISEEGLDGARGVSRKGSVQLMQENISTMIHELAHEFLHGKEARTSGNSQVRELQAEGVAYVVLKEFDLPAEHASKYLALWKIDPENIKSNEEEIRKASTFIIDYIYAFANDGEEAANQFASEKSLLKQTTVKESFPTFKKYLLNRS